MEELKQELGERFANLFRGYTLRFGSFEIPPGQPVGKQKGVAKTLTGPLIPKCYYEHLEGKKGLGIIPLLDDNECATFGCIDIDKYPMDYLGLQRDIENLPLTITKSKSGGAHLWLFTGTPVSAKLIQDVLKIWACELGFGKSEIFPKQNKRLTSEDAGNWINLPFFGDNRKAFIHGKEASLEVFLDYAEERTMNEETLQHLIKKFDERPLFFDGPPCLAELASKGIGSGSRNMIMLNVGSYFKKKSPATFLTELLAFNKKHLIEPLPESEIHGTIAKSLQRKSYPYQCNQEPLCSACNRPACLKREYGVGGSAEELEIMLTGLTKINTEPPTWYINIDGVRVELANIDTLMTQRNLRVLAAESIHKLFTTIKASAWDKVVRGLLDTVEVIEAPADSSVKGQIGDEIREFIQIRGQQDDMEQVLLHTAYIDDKEKRAYFRSMDLMRGIKRNLGNTVTVTKVWAFLKSFEDYDAKDEMKWFNSCGNVRVWSISTKGMYMPSTGVAVPFQLSSKVQDIPF